MKTKTNKLFATLMLALLCVGAFTGAKAQTIIVADSFRNKSQAPDTTTAALPKGWVTNNKYNTWSYNSQKPGNIMNGKGNVTYAFTTVPAGLAVDTVETITSPDLGPTTGYSTISVSWVSRISTNWQGANLDSTSVWWSTNGTSWTKINYHPTYNPGSSAYFIMNGDTPIALPSAAAGAAHFYLRWRADIATATGNYQFTDIVLYGSKSTGISDVIYALNPKVTAFASNNLLHLQFSNTNGAEAQVYVYDMNGKTMLSQNMSTSSDQLINISNFANGIYTIRVIVGGQATTTKFVK